MVQQVQMVQISLVPRWSRRHLLITQISLVINIKHQMLLFKFLGQAGYSATSAGMVQISLGRQVVIATSAYNSNFGDNAGFQATNADSSNFFGQLAGSHNKC
jgi:hypothetical protein